MKTLKLMSRRPPCLAATTIMAQGRLERIGDQGVRPRVSRRRARRIHERHRREGFHNGAPLSIDVRMTENTAQIDVGEGVLGSSSTSFKILHI